MVQAQAWVSHTDAVLLAQSRLAVALRDAERGQRGYLITGRPAYLSPYTSSMQSVRRLHAELRQLTSDNPAQQKRVRDLGGAIERKLDELSRSIALRDEQGVDAAIALVESDEGLHLMQSVNAQMDTIAAEERRLLQDRLDQAQRAQSHTESSIRAGTGVLVVLLIATAWLVRRSEGALADQARRLSELVADLRGEAKRKEAFLATLAHELRNPLAPILSSAALLRTGRAPPELITRATAVIQRQVRQMTRLLDDLLTLTRLNLDKLQLHLGEVSALECLESAIEMVQPEIERRGQQLSVRRPPPELRLRADGPRLTQVIGNLLANASKFSADGGPIELAADASSTALVIRVIDRGVGIPPDQMTRVFNPFFQVGSSGGHGAGGLGVGLALVKQLVELHGGEVQLESAGDQQGTTATVTVPLEAGVMPENLLHHAGHTEGA